MRWFSLRSLKRLRRADPKNRFLVVNCFAVRKPQVPVDAGPCGGASSQYAYTGMGHEIRVTNE